MTDGGLPARLRGFTWSRQCLGGAAPDAMTALRAVIAVYSAHPSAPLSLHARCRGLSPAAFAALDGLRLPAMRGSIHLLPRDTAHLAFRAVPEPPAAAARRLRTFGVAPERYRALRQAVLAAAAEPRTAAELREVAGGAGTAQGVIGAMTREGVLVRVGAPGLRSNELRYAAAEVPAADADAALAWLAGEYLRAFGPARVEDLAWWAGVPLRRASAALDAVPTEGLDGGLLLRTIDRAAFASAAAPPRGAVDLLPKWDCLTMAYPRGGRGRFAHAEVADRLYDARGDGLPAVLVGGEAVGTWSLAPGRRPVVRLELVETPGPRLRAALARRVAAVEAFLA